MTAPVPPYDEQIQKAIDELAGHPLYWQDEIASEKVREGAAALVALATAAAYRHAAARVRAVAFDDTDRGGFVGLAAFFEAWAEKAEHS